MTDEERRAIEWDCAQTTIRFYNRLDAADGEGAARLFAQDGIWYKMAGDEGWTGREEIAAYVNRVRERGPMKDAAEADRVVFHLVLNLEVEAIDADTAEVRAVTVVIPGARHGAADAHGWTNGISGIFPTVERHRRTPEGWRIASKRTSLAMRVGAPG